MSVVVRLSAASEKVAREICECWKAYSRDDRPAMNVEFHLGNYELHLDTPHTVAELAAAKAFCSGFHYGYVFKCSDEEKVALSHQALTGRS